jgi:hypothetical protein
MHIAILTFDGFNELDSLIALGTVRAQSTLEDARSAEAVVVGSDADDLSTHQEPSGGPAAPRTLQAGVHREIPRHRG